MKPNENSIFIITAVLVFTVFICSPLSFCKGCECYKNKVVLLGLSGLAIISIGGVVYNAFLHPFTADSDENKEKLSHEVKALYHLSEIQEKKYNEVPTIASHNSFTYPDNELGWFLQPAFHQNQILNTIQQLDLGVRTFLIDVETNKDSDASITFSHAGVSFKKEWSVFLKEIRDFLFNNPNEIITLHLESSVENYSKIMRDITTAKLNDYIYTVADNSMDWDTVGQMIKNNKRLLIFSDANDDCGPGIMNARYYVLENHYERE